MELKKKVEALLFSSGKRMSVTELTKLCSAKEADLKEAISLLKKEYEEKNSSLMLVEDGDGWKLTVHDNYVPIVRSVVAETELPKSVIETLAVIAWKSPVLQSQVIKVRTNKAYDHIKLLEEQGFITKKKHGRTFMIKLAEKFFAYFDLRGKQEIIKSLGVEPEVDQLAELNQAQKQEAFEKEAKKIEEILKEPKDDSIS